MSKLLVPIDFSDASINAIKYAVGISKVAGSAVVLFHAQPLPAAPIIEPGYHPGDMKVQLEAMKVAQENLQRLASKYDCEFYKDSFEMMDFSTEVKYGGMVDTINRIIQENNDFDLLIMGTEGASGTWSEWLGTHASDVLEGTDLPVLVIPKESKYNGINSIALATNTIDLEQQSVKDLLDFSEIFDAELSMVNVEKVKGEHPEYIDIQLTAKIDKEPLQELHYTKIRHQDVESALLEFAEAQGLDILAVIRPKRGIIESIFHKSLSKQLVMHSKTPVLVMRKY